MGIRTAIYMVVSYQGEFVFSQDLCLRFSGSGPEPKGSHLFWESTGWFEYPYPIDSFNMSNAKEVTVDIFTVFHGSSSFTIKDSFNYGPYTMSRNKDNGLLLYLIHRHDIDYMTPNVWISENKITYFYGVEYISDELVYQRPDVFYAFKKAENTSVRGWGKTRKFIRDQIIKYAL